MRMSDAKLKDLCESNIELKNAAKAIEKQSLEIETELNNFALEVITNYEKNKPNYPDVIRRIDDLDQDFDILDCWPRPEFKFEAIDVKKRRVYLSASYCYDQWEPSYWTIGYIFPMSSIEEILEEINDV